MFRRTDQPARLPRGSRLRWRESIWRVDETADRDDHVLAVDGGAGVTAVDLPAPGLFQERILLWSSDEDCGTIGELPAAAFFCRERRRHFVAGLKNWQC